MYLAIIDLFERSGGVWNSNAPLVTAYTRFKTLVKDITDNSLIQQQNDTTGYTADKKAKRDELVKATFSLCLKLKSFANVNGNTILAKSATLSMNDLEDLSETELINTATTLADTAHHYTTVAADFQVTPELITQLQQDVNNYTPLIIHRNSVGNKRSLATANLKTLYSNAAKQLKLVNDLLNALVDDKAFVDAFYQAKKMTKQSKSAKPEEPTPAA